MKITISAERLARAIERVPREVTESVAAAFERSGLEFVGEMKKRFGARKDRLRVRSGKLREGIGYRVTGRGRLDDLKLTVFVSGVVYARIQELGGEIKPKKGKYLTVPSDSNSRNDGSLRYATSRQAQQAGAKFIVIKKTGKTVRLVAFTEKGKIKEVLFWLVEKVELPGPNAPTKKEKSRLGFVDTWDRLNEKRIERIQKAFAEGVRRSFRRRG